MTAKRIAALICMALLVSGLSYGGENTKFRLAPYMGGGNLNVEAESSFGSTVDISMNSFILGFDVFAERQMKNPKLFVGADFNYQNMSNPEMKIDDVELTDNPDVSISTIFIGPSLRYFLTDNFYFLGTGGLVILWSSGEDDVMDTTLFGPGFSGGLGYDFPSKVNVQFGLYARILFYLAYGSDDDLELDYSSRYMTPLFGISILF